MTFFPVQSHRISPAQLSAQRFKRANIQSPSCNIVEDEHAYTLSVDLPGVERDSIQVQIEKQLLLIEAKREAKMLEGFQRLHTEFSTRTYQQQVNIGDLVDVERIKAVYEAGVLSLTLPKKEKLRPRKISVDIA